MEKRKYHSGTFEKGLDVLETLERSHDPLRVQDVVELTSLERAAVFRLLCTLEDRGYIERLPDKRYRAVNRRWRPRIAYVAPLFGNSFRNDVTAGLQGAAVQGEMELVLVESEDQNLESQLAAVQNLISSGVNLVILFQRIGAMGYVLADRLIHAGVPVISVDNPIPGALYFGGNSYRAGLLAGAALGRFAKEHWNSSFDKLLLLESSLSAPENRARTTGSVEGIREVLGDVPESKIMHLDGLAGREASRLACADAFASLPAKSRVLISSFNDIGAAGALQAVCAAKLQKRAVIVGQNGSAESRAELMLPESPIIASVAYFPEKYGEKLIRLASSVLAHEKTPLAVYTDHVLLDHDNIYQYYPAI
jgi:ribose transport system substrate-binding protein